MSGRRHKLRRPTLSGRQLRLERLEPRHVLSAANLLITELMASNSSALIDGDGNYGDWIEVHNADTVAVDLSDYFLTDSAENLTRWAFPQTLLAAGGYLVVFATTPLDDQGNPLDDYVDAGGNLHTNFSLSSSGEYLALVHEDPVSHDISVVHEYAEYPEQRNNVSYGIDGLASLAYFAPATPGLPNGAGLSGVVADTTFSVDRGFYDAPIQVGITTQTEDALIYYTTNGDVPTPATGTLYTGSVTIDRTTVLRAAAFLEGYLPTNVDTQTYLFLDDVVRQNHQSTLDAGFPATWRGFPADYGLDPDVIGLFDASGNPVGGDLFGGIYAATIKDDLLSIPTLSIVMDVDDMFGTTGIYSLPTADGLEKKASAEWITTDGSPQFQIDAGIQIQGGAFRSHSLTRKHSFRLLFKGEHGPSTLDFPLFGEDAANQFNTIVLRAGANDGYSWSNARFTEQYIRDQFGRGLQRAGGRPSPHGNFAHLYINGVYWGLYNPVERPDSHFAASYFGGDPANWDSIHDGQATEGDLVAWNALHAKTLAAGSSLADFFELQGKNIDGTPSATVAPLLNIESYIDYITINVWGGNWDWPRKNYWAARDRNEHSTTGFEFFNWDFENTMGNDRFRSPLDATALDQDFTGSDNAGQFHLNLLANPEYKLKFADRVHKFFFNDGILTPQKLIERYEPIADRVERAIVAESARWGDQHYSTAPLTLTEWRAERDWMLGTYLPQRTAIVLAELKSYGLYPDVVAPSFSQHGGQVGAGSVVTITASAGEIWYTLDGSDPREIGGALSAGAQPYDGAIEIPAGLVLRARVLSDGVWSALNEAQFTTEPPGDVTKLRITELHYHPADAEEHEFVEVMNTSSGAVSLDGVAIGNFASEPYVFPSGLSLAAGQRIVVARNPSDFGAHYGTSIFVSPLGYANANLSNGGESISLLGPEGQLLQHFTYDDAGDWPTAPDGGGPSLEYIGPFDQDASDPLDVAGDPYDNPLNWRASIAYGGSPGTDGAASDPDADFDADGEVTGLDFLVWQRNFGRIGSALHSQGDADRNGLVNHADLAAWESQYGTTEEPAPDDADFNDDGEISGLDFLAWQRNFSIPSGASFEQGDANHDGAVNSADLAIWETQYNTPPPMAAALAASSAPINVGPQLAALAAVQAGYPVTDSVSRDEALDESQIDELFLEATVNTPAIANTGASTPQDEALASSIDPDDSLADDLFAPLEEELV